MDGPTRAGLGGGWAGHRARCAALPPAHAQRLGPGTHAASSASRSAAPQPRQASLHDPGRADPGRCAAVENYQFPLIADERWAGATLLQRLFGLVDPRTDREVWMLYTSVLPVVGPGLLWIYAAEAEAVGVGSTGGGPDIPGHPQVPALDWDAFSRDLRLAR